MRWLMGCLLFACLTLVQAAETQITIGYLGLEDDPRYRDSNTFWRIPGQPWGRPLDGAKVALKELKFPLQAAGYKLKIEDEEARDEADALAQLKVMAADGIQFVMLDLPGDVTASLAAKSKGMDVLLMNVSAVDDALRQQQCQAHLLHTIPSRTMLTDAMAQFLISRKWREILVLRGPEKDDQAYYKAIQRSAKRFGLKLEATKDFVLGTDPRQRNRNNVALLTSREDYDVVWVADALGEFARAVPYQIQDPRPVVGSAGLIAQGWHWAYERHGAPQLNKRFIKKAKRRMTGYDWAAWIAVRAIGEALVRVEGSDFKTLRDYIRSDEIILDGFKGFRVNFRSWNNQLRQPVMLVQGNWVTQRAPIDGFLHQTNNLDTLGFDERENKCRF